MKKILIVEDELAYIKILESKLQENNYQTIIALNGKEGLDMAAAERPDLILLDIRMPVMNGIEMLAELRKNEANKNTMVIILTNLEPTQETINSMLIYKPIYYLVKSDISLDDLSQMITDLFNPILPAKAA